MEWFRAPHKWPKINKWRTGIVIPLYPYKNRVISPIFTLLTTGFGGAFPVYIWLIVKVSGPAPLSGPGIPKHLGFKNTPGPCGPHQNHLFSVVGWNGSHGFSAIYRGEITPFITIVERHLVIFYWMDTPRNYHTSTISLPFFQMLLIFLNQVVKCPSIILGELFSF